MTGSAEVRGACVFTGVHERPSQCSTSERVERPALDHPTAQQSSGEGHAVPYGRAATAVCGVGVATTVQPPGRPDRHGATERLAYRASGGRALVRPGSDGSGATGPGSHDSKATGTRSVLHGAAKMAEPLKPDSGP
jgi:hypothetical protein